MHFTQAKREAFKNLNKKSTCKAKKYMADT